MHADFGRRHRRTSTQLAHFTSTGRTLQPVVEKRFPSQESVESTCEQLGRHRELLQAKRNLLEGGGWGFNDTDSSEKPDVAGVEKQLADIEASLMELGGDNSMFEAYLNILVDVLGNPETYLWSRKETLTLDGMRIKRAQGAFNTS